MVVIDGDFRVDFSQCGSLCLLVLISTSKDSGSPSLLRYARSVMKRYCEVLDTMHLYEEIPD